MLHASLLLCGCVLLCMYFTECLIYILFCISVHMQQEYVPVLRLCLAQALDINSLVSTTAVCVLSAVLCCVPVHLHQRECSESVAAAD